ncbi:MAG: hypothetical protein J6U07_03935 [Fibrobacter sp.]|nr:hypothetical protein [Fibrobacter sp.]
MKQIARVVLCLVLVLVGARLWVKQRAQDEAFNRHESLIAEATECVETGEWNCAEKSIRALLQESPDDENLQTHLAGILFEQERYDECRAYIAGLKFSNEETKYFDGKAASLIREMAELGIERSMHFRVEFEGRPSRADVMEALAVLEVAYDSLTHLFDFRPDNKMHLVLYQSAEYQGMDNRPGWVGALFDGKLRVPVNMMKYPEIYRPILFHELTHAFVRAMTRKNIPLWLNEGIAQVVDASRNGEPRPAGPEPSITALTEPFVKESRTDVAVKLYWYSQRMVEELLKRDPKSASADFSTFRDCIRDIRKLGVDESLRKYYGVTTAQLLEAVK